MKYKRKKVYVLGDSRGVYRVPNVIKFLADHPKQYSFLFDNRASNNRPWKYIKALFREPFRVAGSNIIYICILNVDIDILYALLFARLFHKKILLDYYISIYEKVVVDEKWFKPESTLGKLAKWLDRFYYNSASKVIFLNHIEREHYCEISDIKAVPEKESIVPLCIEETFKVKRQDSNIFNVCWWGSYLPLHGLKYVFLTIKILKEKGLPIQWYFFGNSVEKGKEYVDLAKEYGIIDVCHFENNYTMKNGKLQEFLSANCDLALGNFGDSPKAKMVMNNKVLDACAMKVPIFTGNASAYYAFFDGKSDVYMSPNDPTQMAKTIETIFNEDKDTLQKRIEKSYTIFTQNFTVKLFREKLENILNSL